MDLIGQKIGPYEVKRKLGEGGMGAVWLATHTFLGQDRAIKLLSDRLGDSGSAKSRFLKEATEAVKLQHPGIATVYDAGEDAGRIFIAFEYIDGKTLVDLLRERPFRISEAARIAKEVAGALDHAHSKSIIHRDVTGRNIMVNRKGNAVLVDFGLALNQEGTRLTLTGGSLMGTVPYMAPEVAQGKEADPRSDIYSLGVVLYEMLTGRLPFTGERAEAVLLKVVQNEAESLDRYRPNVPKELVRIVERAMNKDPGKRYQSALDMARDLEAIQEFEEPDVMQSTIALTPVTPPPSSVGVSRITTWIRRNPIKGATGIVLVAAASVALIRVIPNQSSGLDPVSTAYPSLAVMPVQTLSGGGAEPIARELGRSLARKLKAVSGVRVSPWETSGRRNPEVDLPSVIAQELGVKFLVMTTLKKSGLRLELSVALVEAETGTQSWARSYEELESDFLELESRVSVALALHLKPDLTQEERNQIERKSTFNPEAHQAYMEGAATWTGSDDPVAIQRALEKFEQATRLDPSYADAHVGIGAVYSAKYFRGKVGEDGLDLAEQSFRKALESDPGHPRALQGLIRVLWNRGQNEACLQIGEEVRRTQDPDDPEALMARGVAYFLGGLPSLSVPFFERVQQIDPMNDGAAWFNVAAKAWSGDAEGAVQAANDYLRDFEEDGEILLWGGVGYNLLGELESAEQYYRRAIEIFGVNSNHYIYMFIPRLYEQLGKPEEARDLCIRAKEHLQILLEFHPDNVRMQSTLLGIDATLGDREETDRIAQELDLEHTENGYILFYPASGYAKLGDEETAIRLLRRWVALGAATEMIMNVDTQLDLDRLRNQDAYGEFLKEFEIKIAELKSRYGSSPA